VLNLRKGSVATPANDVSTTAYCQFSFRYPTSYTPGAAGVAGTFVRPGVWRDVFIAPVAAAGTLAMDTTYSYKIYADKSKIMFGIEFPPATGYSPMFFHIGLPDSMWCTEGGNRGMLFGGTTSAVVTAKNFWIADTPAGMGSVADIYVEPCICTLAPKNPNNDGKYVVSDICYGSSTEGIRGQINGVIALPTDNIVTGDIVKDDGHTYYILNCHVLGTNSFQSPVVGVRIE
jgi:hypothetical protein